MDQNSTNGTDKRNWRERLGIGAKVGTDIKDMPRASDDFKPVKPAAVAVTRPVVQVGVKPAPMAPRLPVKVAPPVRPSTIAPEALANKLKSQRDAAEKLAEQRVMAAKQRAEAALPITPAKPGKPKFSFAEEEPKSVVKTTAPVVAPPPATVQRPVVAPPSGPPQRPVPPQQKFQTQLTPPRPQLGGSAVAPRVAPPPAVYQKGQQYGVPPYQQQRYAPSQQPQYRPIDPNAGYAQGGYASPPRQQYGSPGQQPRMPMPQPRVPAPNLGGGYAPESGTRGNQRLANPGQFRGGYNDGSDDDIFEQTAPRGQRRATANDYNQAYREAESGYDDEAPRSRGLLILLSLLALALLVAVGAVLGYSNFIKPKAGVSTSQTVPLVKAPGTPTKATPGVAAGDNANGVSASAKKLIYDRIEGDHEVSGGQLIPSEEKPVQPAANNGQQTPVPDAKATGTGDDGTPLPLPPPPGSGGGTQGSLEPSGKSDKSAQAQINPAAGASSAADLPQASNGKSDASVGLAKTPLATNGGASVIAPQLKSSQSAATDNVAAAPLGVGSESISDGVGDPTIPPEPIVKTKKPTQLAQASAAKKASDAAGAPKSLGSKPVVLVPPANPVAGEGNGVPVVVAEAPSVAGGGLYGDTAVGNVAAPVAAPQPKKQKSLFDLFKAGDQTSAAPAQVASAPQAAVAAPAAPAVKPAGTGAYVAQLGSFKTKAEANQEYARLVAIHGAIIQRYAPIIEEANVASTTRYRLNIGPMATNDVASSLCSSLFAAGERDCLVHRL